MVIKNSYSQANVSCLDKSGIVPQFCAGLIGTCGVGESNNPYPNQLVKKSIDNNSQCQHKSMIFAESLED